MDTSHLLSLLDFGADFGVTDPDAASHWRQGSLCAQVDPDAFYPDKGESSGAARDMCRQCPVRVDCLAEAVRNGERWGIWGGLNERERRRITDPDDTSHLLAVIADVDATVNAARAARSANGRATIAALHAARRIA